MAIFLAPGQLGVLGLGTLVAVLGLLGCGRSLSAEQQQAENAEQTFRTVCARCHGSDGKGGVGPEGSSPPRNFCDAAFQANRTDEQLKLVIRTGKGAMPGFGQLFSEADLQGLVRKLRSFSPDLNKP